jgi:hypothetical protein
MAGDSIGVLSVDLVANSAQFTSTMNKVPKDARAAFAEVRQAAQQADRSFDMAEAKGSLALLSEELGVKIPRHLRGFIADLPGVGTALTGAFSGVAVFALIEVVTKAVEKIKQYWEELAKLSKEEQELYDKATKGAKDLLTARVENIKAEYELRIAKADGIEKDRLRVEQATAIVKLNRDYVGTLEQEKSHLDDLLKRQEKARDVAHERQSSAVSLGREGGVGGALAFGVDAEIAQRRIEGTDKSVADLSKTLQSADNALKVARASAINAGTALKDHLGKDAETATKQLDKMVESLRRIQTGLPDRRLGGILANAPVNADPTGVFRQGQAAGDLFSKIPEPSKPIYSGSTSAMDLEKIKTDQQAAVTVAQRVTEALKSEDDKWREQLAIVTELHNQHKLSDEEFEKAQKSIQDHLTKTNVDWKEFGSNVAKTVESAVLMGRSWSDAFKAIAVQLVEVLLKMTLLKDLQEAMGGAGAGAQGGSGDFLTGVLGGLLGGITPHAMGGTIAAGGWGLVGEEGPELIYGGTRGVDVIPNGQLRGGSGDTHNYSIDLRGSSMSPAEVRAAVVAGISVATKTAQHQIRERILRS